MAHECGCHCDGIEPISAEQTVSAIVQRYPGALEVMKRLGVNHCCGAHLTLREAAAAVGLPLETLLAELETSQKAHA